MVRTILLMVLLLISVYGLYSQELTGQDIIQKVNDLINVETSFGKQKMTIKTSSGGDRTFIMESWSKDRGEKNLVRYLEPKRVKGQATLMLNHADDIWMYFPRTKRVRRLATHAKKQKVQGSDFSYEDMGSGDAFIEDFIANRIDDEEMEGEDCFKLELIKKPESDLSYSRLIMWVTKENYLPIVIDYYNEDDPMLNEKRLIQSDMKIIDEIPVAMKAVMYNKKDNTHTSLELLEIQFNVQLDDDMFTERALKK